MVATEQLVGSLSRQHDFHSLETSVLGQEHERQCRGICYGIIVEEAPVIEAGAEIVSRYPADIQRQAEVSGDLGGEAAFVELAMRSHGECLDRRMFCDKGGK